MNQEWLARGIIVTLLAVVVIISLVGAFSGTLAANRAPMIKLYAAMPENGGWSQEVLNAEVGKPLVLYITSEDVVHGFAVGQMASSDVELYPGIPTSTTLIFDQPGSYTFYCTRWCGPNHWRMRGIIDVQGETLPDIPSAPRYVHLNIDIDSPHLAESIPAEIPDAARGAQWKVQLPAYALQKETYWAQSPAQIWEKLRAESALRSLSDGDVWDTVAWIWSRQSSQVALVQAQEIYLRECSACHGETGKGDGVMVRDLMPFSYDHSDFGHALMRPPDFSNPEHILGAPPALLEGKILRGGMGTGMPLYGPIYTLEEQHALVSYLYKFVLAGW